MIEMALKRTKEFFESLGFATNLKAYNIGAKEVDKIVKQLISHQMIKLGELRNITPESVRKMMLINI